MHVELDCKLFLHDTGTGTIKADVKPELVDRVSTGTIPVPYRYMDTHDHMTYCN